MRLWSGQSLESAKRIQAEFSLFNPSPDCQIRFLNLMLHLFRGWSYDWCLRFEAPETLTKAHECEHSKQKGMKNDDSESAWLHPTTLGFPFENSKGCAGWREDGQKFNSLNYCCRSEVSVNAVSNGAWESWKLWRDFWVSTNIRPKPRAVTPLPQRKPQKHCFKVSLGSREKLLQNSPLNVVCGMHKAFLDCPMFAQSNQMAQPTMETSAHNSSLFQIMICSRNEHKIYSHLVLFSSAFSARILCFFAVKLCKAVQIYGPTYSSQAAFIYEIYAFWSTFPAFSARNVTVFNSDGKNCKSCFWEGPPPKPASYIFAPV